MRPVLIAGGGIAGLSLALALHRVGIASHILEARSEVSEAGAGIQRRGLPIERFTPPDQTCRCHGPW